MRAGWVTLLFLALAPGHVSGEDFEFVVIGDTRPRFESESFRAFEGLIGRINSLKPSLVVNLGDLIYGYGPLPKEHQWDKYQAVIGALQVPYYQLPGNHDTHSKAARRVYGRRFGKFYQSFDHGNCHFVLLDNTENERWGYLGPAQLAWLRNDLKQAHPRPVFVFLHFPVWEPERITPAHHEFWLKTLHPLFKESNVRAVFGGHYHTYGPTHEFDGIRYFITGGGGAELRPEYRKSGGSHHFMRVRLLGDNLDIRVVTEQGELSDAEADVMGGLQFASRNVSRIGVRRDLNDLGTGMTLTVAVKNPYATAMKGEANWLLDASAFSIEPEGVTLDIPPGATRSYEFTLKARRAGATLQSLPQLAFSVKAGTARHRFHREVRFLNEMRTPFQLTPPLLDGMVSDWEGIPALKLGSGRELEVELRSRYDAENLYLAVTIPKCDSGEAKESGFSDELQIGLARPLSQTDFSRDLLRLGFNSDTREAKDRTPGRRWEGAIPGMKSGCRTQEGRTTYEICMPLRLLKGLRAGEGRRLVLDLSFPAGEPTVVSSQSAEPAVNTFSYRVRYGSDSLVPVYFVELNFEPRQ